MGTATATVATYWKRYKAISPWVAMSVYMATFVAWGILFLPPATDRLLIALLVIPLGVLFDYLLHKSQTGKPNWQSALITSSIITVLMPPDVALYVPPLAVLLAIGSKHLLLLDKRHIYNPAALGVALTALVFGYSLGWWPDSFLWLTLFFGLLNVWRVKKFPQVLSFLAVFAGLTLITNGSLPTAPVSSANLGVQTLPVILPYFFALFMVPEPMTSLDGRWRQVEFGVITAVIGFGAGYVGILAPAAVLWGLLAANLYAALRRS